MSHVADVDLATRLARDAAAAVLAVKSEARAQKQTKADSSPVTVADWAADKILRAGLAATGDVVVTEETWAGASMPASGRVWVIDPIDGTEDFVHGTDDYVVQVGLVVDGAPRLGVVLQPETGVVWRGIVDGEASVCERLDPDGTRTPLRLPAAGPGPERPRIAVSVSHPSALVDFIVRELGGQVCPRGSVGLKAAMVVQGDADAYVTGSRRIKVWDTAAPAALVLAAGGLVSGLTQQPLVYDGAVVHEDGVCMWSTPTRKTLLPRLQAALRRFTYR